MIGAMELQWYGQSAFRLFDGERTVFIDPFDDMSSMAGHGVRWDYPPIEGVTADLLLVTHEHFDHNGVDAISGEPTILRSTAGTLESPIGEVVAIASEHDDAAGTQRGPNTIFAFDLDGIRVAHFGDFGQAALRPEQAAALEGVELLIIPVGGGPTIGAAAAAQIVAELAPRWVVPMHYRTPSIGFLETADEFLGLMDHVERLDKASFDTTALPVDDGPVVVVPAAP
jgi:L-ascorbate metabolism protein UlaG (beta-lactamase superfamily)